MGCKLSRRNCLRLDCRSKISCFNCRILCFISTISNNNFNKPWLASRCQKCPLRYFRFLPEILTTTSGRISLSKELTTSYARFLIGISTCKIAIFRAQILARSSTENSMLITKLIACSHKTPS